jgi:hypothetical protein
MKFDSVKVQAFSAIEIPAEIGGELPAAPLVIDISTIEGHLDAWPEAGFNAPLLQIGYQQIFALGEIDLTQYAHIIMEYSYDGDNPRGGKTAEQSFTDAAHTPIIGLTALEKPFGYADVVNQDAIEQGVYVEMPYSPGMWSGAIRTATIDLPAEIDYNGPCYVSAFNPWDTAVVVLSITLIPRA